MIAVGSRVDCPPSPYLKLDSCIPKPKIGMKSRKERLKLRAVDPFNKLESKEFSEE